MPAHDASVYLSAYGVHHIDDGLPVVVLGADILGARLQIGALRLQQLKQRDGASAIGLLRDSQGGLGLIEHAAFKDIQQAMAAIGAANGFGDLAMDDRKQAPRLVFEALFVERPEGVFELRRGFRLKPGQRVLMMEDVVTTGLSSREAIAAIAAAGGKVVAAGALVDRSNGSVDLGVPFFPLIRLEVPTYAADALPAELAAIPAIKPGSRKEAA